MPRPKKAKTKAAKPSAEAKARDNAAESAVESVAAPVAVAEPPTFRPDRFQKITWPTVVNEPSAPVAERIVVLAGNALVTVILEARLGPSLVKEIV